MGSFNLTEEAELQILTIVEYIASESPVQAWQVYRAFLETFSLLASQPKLSPLFKTSDFLRRHPGAGKIRSYNIYYRADGESIDILHVIHGARDQEQALRDPEA